MPQYEYQVIPAPSKGEKARGVKTPEGRFAQSIQTVLNQMATDGWEFQRAELLPSDERSGLTGTTTNWRNLLIFRRPRREDASEDAPHLLNPSAPAPGPGPVVVPLITGTPDDAGRPQPPLTADPDTDGATGQDPDKTPPRSG